MKQPEHNTIFGEAISGVNEKGRHESKYFRRRGVNREYGAPGVALQKAVSECDREREFRKQHGKVRIIVKDGKPVCD